MRIPVYLLLSASLVFADPAWKDALTSAKPGPHPPIGSSKLEFSLSWKGMLRAGALDIEFAPAGVSKTGSFVIKSSASSRGAAATLFPYSHSYWSEIDPRTLEAKFFHSTETDSEETVETVNRYTASEVVVSEKSTEVESGTVSTEKFTFPHGPARDLFSAILHLRSQKLTPGDEHVMLILPFKSPYLLTVRVEAKEKHLSRDTIRLSLSLRKINTKTHELGRYKKLKKPVTLWLSDDADRVLLEVRAAVYIGDVRAVLTKHTKTP